MSRTEESDPVYQGTVKYCGLHMELWRTSWKVNRTHFAAWYVKVEGMGMDERAFLDTRGGSPAEAIGKLILYGTGENDELMERLYGN